MADWMKQSEEMMKTWTRAQQDLWDAWKRSMPSLSATPASASMNQAMSFWKEAIDRSLNAQMEWAKLWAESMKAQQGAPKELGAWADQMLATMKSWNESQTRLWEGMIDSLGAMTPEALRQRMDQGAQGAIQSWQEAMQKAIQAQHDLSAIWGGKKKG